MYIVLKRGNKELQRLGNKRENTKCSLGQTVFGEHDRFQVETLYFVPTGYSCKKCNKSGVSREYQFDKVQTNMNQMEERLERMGSE